MDRVDKEIVEMLRENSRIPFVEIARKLNIPESSVRYRIKNLISRGVIKRFTVELGKDGTIEALTLIKVHPQTDIEELCKEILKKDCVCEIYEISGAFDIALLLCASDMKNINDTVNQIRSLERVKETITHFVMKKHEK